MKRYYTVLLLAFIIVLIQVLTFVTGKAYLLTQLTMSAYYVLVAVGLIHAVYAVVQFGVTMGVLGGGWATLDVIYNAQIDSVKGFTRATGLLGNPNSYGLYCAVLMAVLLATRMTNGSLLTSRKSLFVLAAILVGLVLSGSRSALLGVIVMMLAVAAVNSLSRRFSPVGVLSMVVLGLVIMAVSPLLAGLLPEFVADRFVRFMALIQRGSGVDPSADARLEMWARLWEIYGRDYPFGTWAPPSYALKAAVDSYYLVTALQGTPVYTLFWLLFLWSVSIRGVAVFLNLRQAPLGGIGLSIVFFAAVVMGAGLGMSPMPLPFVIAPFWTLLGIMVYLDKGIKSAPYLPEMIPNQGTGPPHCPKAL